MPSIRRIALVLLPVAVSLGALVSSSSADLGGQYQSGQQRAAQLRATIHDETSRIDDFEGTIGQLQSRLGALERSVAIQEQLLATVNQQLATARQRLVALRARYAHDLAVLGAELRAAYETPPPTVVGVVVDSAGFNQLLNGLNDLTAIERRNTRTAEAVAPPAPRSRRRRSPSHESRHGVGARPRRSSPSATRSRS